MSPVSVERLPGIAYGAVKLTLAHLATQWFYWKRITGFSQGTSSVVGHQVPGDIKCRGTSSVGGHKVSGDIMLSFSQRKSSARGHQVSGEIKCQGTSSIGGHQVSGDIKCRGT